MTSIVSTDHALTEACERSRKRDQSVVAPEVKVGSTLFWALVSAKATHALFSPQTSASPLLTSLLGTPSGIVAASAQLLASFRSPVPPLFPLVPSARTLTSTAKALGWLSVALLGYCPIGRLAFAAPLRRLAITLHEALHSAQPQRTGFPQRIAVVVRVFAKMARSRQGTIALVNAILLPMMQAFLNEMARNPTANPVVVALGSLASRVLAALRVLITASTITAAYTQLNPRHLIPTNPWQSVPQDIQYSARAPKSHTKVGVLICNLGTPVTPQPRDVAAFLRPFLSDQRVVEILPWVWRPVLNLLIIPRRKYSSGDLYARLFATTGSDVSPLTVHTSTFAEALQRTLGDQCVVAAGMRYGEPSIASQLRYLKEQQCEHIVVFPDYPQYSGTTTASIYDAVFDAARKYRFTPALHIVRPFYDKPEYIVALAHVARAFLAANGYSVAPGKGATIEATLPPGTIVIEKVLISFHGIPERYHTRGDPYPHHCEATARALAVAMGWEDSAWTMTYQSVFGKDPWLLPATDDTLAKLAREGTKRVAVICPGFLTDCLETVDENGTENAKIFQEHGGEELVLIPCLNSDAYWCEQAASIIKNDAKGWFDAASQQQQQQQQQ